jgi:hypothetical protein
VLFRTSQYICALLCKYSNRLLGDSYTRPIRPMYVSCGPHLGPICPCMCPDLAHMGARFGPMGAHLCSRNGAIMGPLWGPIWGPYWAHLGPILGGSHMGPHHGPHGLHMADNKNHPGGRFRHSVTFPVPTHRGICLLSV